MFSACGSGNVCLVLHACLSQTPLGLCKGLTDEHCCPWAAEREEGDQSKMHYVIKYIDQAANIVKLVRKKCIISGNF